jgi:D-inositol-3-phosphate glycosyltransferase
MDILNYPNQKDIRLGMLCLSKSWGGLEIHSVKLAQWLQQRGWNITMFLIKGSPMETLALEIGLPVSYMSRTFKYLDLMSAYQLHTKIQKRGIQLLIVTINKDLSLAATMKRIWAGNIKIVYQQYMQIGVSKKDILHTLRYDTLSAWISPLQSLAHEVTEKTNVKRNKIHVIPLGIEVEKFTRNRLSILQARKMLSISPQATVIGILGRIDPLKGQRFLIEALHTLNHRLGYNLELLVMGEPTRNESEDYLESLKTLTKTLHLEDHVHFRPFSEQTEVFYKAIDIFVMASPNETYGIVTIEAMASGIPIIATNTGGTREILQDGELALLYTPNNQQDFVQNVVTYLNNQEKKRRFIKSAKEQAVAVYSHLNQCQLMENLFTSLT